MNSTSTSDRFEQQRPRLLSLAYRMLGEICWLYTLRNPQKLAVVKALRKLH